MGCMKKNMIKRIIIILATVLLLSGCSMVREVEIESEEDSQNNNTDSTINQTKDLTFVNTMDEDIFGNFGNVQSSLNTCGYSAFLCGGYYCFRQIYQCKSRNLMIDHEGNIKMMCFDSSCNHTVGTCTSLCEMKCPNYYKGDIYYINQHNIEKISDNKCEVIFRNDSYIENLSIKENKLYFSDDTGICTYDIETKEKRCICDIRPICYSLNIYNDVIYFASEDYILYSMEFDGSDLKIVTDNFVFEPQVRDGYLYYRNIKTNELIRHNLTDGCEEAIADYVYQIFVCEDAIYYLDLGILESEESLCGVYKYNYDTGENILIGYSGTEFMVYDGMDYILGSEIGIYFNAAGKRVIEYYPYIMNKNGKNKKKLDLIDFTEVY